jgi:disease resistance protein RPM1
MRSRIVNVSERNKRYDDIVSTYYPSSGYYMNIDEAAFDHHRRSHLLEDSNQNVSSDDMKTKVDSRLKASRASASPQEDKKVAPKVVAITGMCGSGKRECARDIYDDKRKHYDYHAFIELPHNVDVTKVFRDMIDQLSLAPSSGEEEYVAHRIRENLEEKRFLIVFIGLWKLSEWSHLKVALPGLSKSGSLVIVTTESREVAKDWTEAADDILYLPLLGQRKSFEFLKDEILKSENGKMSPEDRQDFQELDLYSLKDQEPPFNTIAKILRKCMGMKLAIRTVAKLLASMKPHRWVEQCEKLCQYFPSMLYNSPDLEEIKRAVTRSYKCLPPYLKPCLLYLSIFPEDCDIKVGTVLDRWVAEGLVREATGLSAQQVAGRYLLQLLDRYMVMVSEFSRSRSFVKTCWIHPLVRDILVMIAQEEKFSIAVDKNKGSIVQAKRFRHLSLDGQSDRKLATYVDLSGIRSLTVFNRTSESVSSLICSSQMKTLRVLDFSSSSFPITQQDIRHIGDLCHLRYLNLCKSSICELPSTIGMLPFLQELNVRKTQITSLPNEITQLKRLRILRASREKQDSCHHRHKQCSYTSDGVTVPKGIDNLETIEGFEVVDVEGSSYLAMKALGKLTWLKYLGLTGLTKKNSAKVSITLKKLAPSLKYLYLGACQNNGTLCYLPTEKASLEFPCLRTIKLEGRIGTVPEWIFHSITVSVIKLFRTNLKQDDIKLMERMHSLKNLALLDGSYAGEKMVFYAGGFVGLKRLDLVGLPNLQVVRFEEKTAPSIEEIVIRSCKFRLFGKKNLKELRDFHPDGDIEVVN